MKTLGARPGALRIFGMAVVLVGLVSSPTFAQSSREGEGFRLLRQLSGREWQEAVEDHTSKIQAKVPPAEHVVFGQKTYPLYPKMLATPPEIASPIQAEDGTDIIVAGPGDQHALLPATVENGIPYIYAQFGKGRQLDVDSADFPTLAGTGLHSEGELEAAKTITGRSVVEITELGRPGRSSGAGFMSSDEDITSVLRSDNRLVASMGLTHPRLARPLFHVWNSVLYLKEAYTKFFTGKDFVQYSGNRVLVKVNKTRGWQESLFNDEIYGGAQLDIWREVTLREREFLAKAYARLADAERAEMLTRLSRIHIGEMGPYYTMRYGFYEGHTEYRADPIAVAFIFGLRTVEEIEAAFPGRLHQALTRHAAWDATRR